MTYDIYPTGFIYPDQPRVPVRQPRRRNSSQGIAKLACMTLADLEQEISAVGKEAFMQANDLSEADLSKLLRRQRISRMSTSQRATYSVHDLAFLKCKGAA